RCSVGHPWRVPLPPARPTDVRSAPLLAAQPLRPLDRPVHSTVTVSSPLAAAARSTGRPLGITGTPDRAAAAAPPCSPTPLLANAPYRDTSPHGRYCTPQHSPPRRRARRGDGLRDTGPQRRLRR